MMIKELKTIKIITEFLKYKNKIPKKIDNIEQIYIFFKSLKDEKEKFNSLYILNYLYSFISSDEVNKRKTNARIFEDLLATIFEGTIADTKHRENLKYEVSNYFINAKDMIAKNRREKADILFDNYQISVKTLMQENNEINMGSFEKNILFDGLNVNNYLFERKGINNAGLGSKQLLSNLFSILITLNKNGWNKFREKFIKMSEFIYSDDLVIAIKNNKKMKMYFLKGSDITQIFYDFSKDKDEILKLINRWEGNSLRIDRKAILDSSQRFVEFDFNFLKNSIISDIDKFDYELHKIYAEFFNTSNINLKVKTLKTLSDLFDKFNKDYENLR